VYKTPGVVPGSDLVLVDRPSEETDLNALGGGDAALLIRYLGGLDPFDPDQETAGDVDLSGGIPNATDLQQLRRFLVFDFASCPGCATWRFSCDSLGTPAGACPMDTVECADTIVNFKGLLCGDVDGSWPNRTTLSAPPPSVAFEFGSPVWRGDRCTVPVLATGGGPIASAVFTFAYDEQAFEAVAVAAGEGARDFELTRNEAQPGALHGLLVRGTPRSLGPEPVLALELRLRPDAERGRVGFDRLLLDDHASGRMPQVDLVRDESARVVPSRPEVRAVPNPFNPATRFEYAVPGGAGAVTVSLRIVDLNGRLVRELVRGPHAPGEYRTAWDGLDGQGRPAASGVYLAQLRAGDRTTTRKAVLVR
jgi:hypothetical protein